MRDSVEPGRDRSGHATLKLSIAIVSVLVVWAAMGVARQAFLLTPGLRARHFASLDWTGEPAHSQIDSHVSTDSLRRGWDFTPPDAFSARWSGYLYVDRGGTYTFATTSDDGSEVYVDGRLVVDNGGRPGLVARTGRTALEAGSHAILINYLNAGGAYQLEWRWAYEGEPLSDVPAWRLSTKPRGVAALWLVRVVDWLWPFGGALLIALVGRLVFVRRWWPKRSERAAHAPFAWRPAALCLALFVAAAVLQTWPLATHPAHLSRNDNADTMLNEWTIAWVAHELPRAPLHLFDANMFYPERHTLAYSETLFVQGVMAAPLLWLGASPVLAYNLVLLAGFILTAWAMCLVVARWTDDWFAGAAAGMMFAFNAHTLTRLPHLQAQHAEFFPLSLLAFDALLVRPRWRTAAWLAVAFALASLTSVYLMVFTAIALGVAFLVRPEDWANARGLALAPRLIFAGLLAGVILLPFLLPYWELRASGFSRSLDEAGFFAATVKDYVTNPGRFHPWVGGGSALFPGFVALALAAVAVASGRALRDARARMCLAFGICGVVLSFGPAVAPGYAFLFETVPLLQGIRTTSRFGYLGIAAVAVLGGYGLAILRRSLASSVSIRRTVSLAVVVLAFLDPFAAPIPYERFDGIRPIYVIPAGNPHAVVAELPLAPPERQFRDAQALLNSTANWRPLLNGYSGFTPPSYVRTFDTINRFPSPDSLAALRAAGVTDVFVHTDQFDPSSLDAIRRESSLHQVAADASVVLYTLAAPVGYR